MKLSNILVSFAATAMAAWIFLFASEVRAHAVTDPAPTASHASAHGDRHS